MGCTVDVISIGTLSRNPFWGEQGAVRPAHATTTLIRDGSTTILVDPSVPPEWLSHRLHERAGLKPSQIDAVFLTCFLPVHRRGLALFEKADWLIHADERSAIMDYLTAALAQATGDRESKPVEIEEELALLRRTRPAPDKLASGVDLFPSPGVTPGTCGLLVAGTRTTIVAGDAVLTRDHYENARVYERCVDADKARRSFAEIVEAAEIIVPGHDNLIFTL